MAAAAATTTAGTQDYIFLFFFLRHLSLSKLIAPKVVLRLLL
jgi:hypothetical protein